MHMRSSYLVAPFTILNDGATIGSRLITAHENQASAIDECTRRLNQRSNAGDKFVVYRAVDLVQRTETPVEVCSIGFDGEVSCE